MGAENIFKNTSVNKSTRKVSSVNITKELAEFAEKNGVMLSPLLRQALIELREKMRINGTLKE